MNEHEKDSAPAVLEPAPCRECDGKKFIVVLRAVAHEELGALFAWDALTCLGCGLTRFYSRGVGTLPRRVRAKKLDQPWRILNHVTEPKVIFRDARDAGGGPYRRGR